MRLLTKRPISITIIGWLFIGLGIVGIAYHAGEFKAQRPFKYDFLWVCFVRLLAILCGTFVLRGSNWARWLLVAWLVFHVILSAFHSPVELVVHSLLSVLVAYFLFRAPSSRYFSGTPSQTLKP